MAQSRLQLKTFAFLAAAAIALIVLVAPYAHSDSSGPLALTVSPPTVTVPYGSSSQITVTPSGGTPPYTITVLDQNVQQGSPITVPSGGYYLYDFRSYSLGSHALGFQVKDSASETISGSATATVVAQSTAAGLPDMCTGPTGGIIPQYSLFGNNIGPEQQLLLIAASILGVMFAIAGILYMVGRSFGLGRLVQTARAELGEIFITVIVVVVFVGSFSLASTSTGTNSFFAAPTGGANNNIFVADCSSLLNTVQTNLIAPYEVLNLDQNIISIIQSLTIKLMVNDWGFSFSPFSGLAILGSILATLMGVTSAFILMMVGVAVLLGLLYFLMPLFLYVGIVLRSMPWTRAAGGAFLGMFAALYLLFPFMLYGMLSVYPSSSSVVSCPLALPGQGQCFSLYQNYDVNNILGTIQQNTGSTITSGSFTGILQFFTSLGYGMVTGFITAVVDPVLYTVFAVVISLFVSFDFMEGMGDLLGAPALEAGNVLRKVV
ncbi:MAG: hypothetical protein KGH60_00280 [Candidatus Micrarchaeota archaeon]|nr:hypothetical protein [Candidatus Micrarchaeota archaeon]